MKKLALLLVLMLAIPLLAGPPRPQITVLNPRCFSTNTSTVLDVYGLNFGGKLSLVVNGKEMPTVVVDSQHLQTTVTFPGPGYVYVQVKATRGNGAYYSTPLAWSYVLNPINLPGASTNVEYSQDLNATVPTVCNFRSTPWYLEP